MVEPDSTRERLHAALLLAVLGTADMHKVDETPLPPLEVARLLSERAVPDVINAMIVSGWTPPSLGNRAGLDALIAYSRTMANKLYGEDSDPDWKIELEERIAALGLAEGF